MGGSRIGSLRPFCLSEVGKVVHFLPFHMGLVIPISVGFYIDEVGDSVGLEAVSLGHSIVVLTAESVFIGARGCGYWDYSV